MKHIPRLIAWGSTPEEHAAAYPCDGYMQPPQRRLTRAIDVQVPADLTFQWICQIKLAPYSYNWIDNLGRRSPALLPPGTERLAKGQHFMLFEIVDFSQDRHMTGVVRPRLQGIAGKQAITYQVSSTGPHSSRIIVCIDLPQRRWIDRVQFSNIFAAGDLIMMRKQLQNLKAYTEGDSSREA